MGVPPICQALARMGPVRRLTAARLVGTSQKPVTACLIIHDGNGVFPRSRQPIFRVSRGQRPRLGSTGRPRLGDQPEGEAPGQFIAPHGICIDSRGDIYVGEVSWTHTGSRLNPPRELRSLQKLARQS